MTKITFKGKIVCYLNEEQLLRFAEKMSAKNKNLIVCEVEYGFNTVFIGDDIIEIQFTDKNNLTKFILSLL